MIDRERYALLFGPTTGDRVRLADTNLLIEVEADLSIGPAGSGDEVVFGGGKVIREPMGQSRATRAEGAPDLVITGALILDHWASSRPTSGYVTGGSSASARPETPTSWTGSTGTGDRPVDGGAGGQRADPHRLHSLADLESFLRGRLQNAGRVAAAAEAARIEELSSRVASQAAVPCRPERLQELREPGRIGRRLRWPRLGRACRPSTTQSRADNSTVGIASAPFSAADLRNGRRRRQPPRHADLAVRRRRPRRTPNPTVCRARCVGCSPPVAAASDDPAAGPAPRRGAVGGALAQGAVGLPGTGGVRGRRSPRRSRRCPPGRG